jgi:hypothetical protein
MVIGVDGSCNYEIDGRRVTKADWDKASHVPPPNYAKGEAPSVRPDMDDFSRDPKGARWMPQLGKKHERKAYVRHAREIADIGRQRGLEVHRS